MKNWQAFEEARFEKGFSPAGFRKIAESVLLSEPFAERVILAEPKKGSYAGNPKVFAEYPDGTVVGVGWVQSGMNGAEVVKPFERPFPDRYASEMDVSDGYAVKGTVSRNSGSLKRAAPFVSPEISGIKDAKWTGGFYDELVREFRKDSISVGPIGFVSVSPYLDCANFGFRTKRAECNGYASVFVAKEGPGKYVVRSVETVQAFDNTVKSPHFKHKTLEIMERFEADTPSVRTAAMAVSAALTSSTTMLR